MTGNAPAGIRLRQLLQNRLCRHTVGSVLSNVAPHDLSIRVDDEHGWRGQAVVEKVIDAIGLAHPVCGVGQHRVADPGALAPSVHYIDGGDDERDHLCPGLLEQVIVTLQLAELRVGASTTTSLEKDQYHRPLVQLL